MDRKAYKLPFRKKSLLGWMCPTCNKGLLQLKKGTFHTEETNNSKKARSQEKWAPFLIECVYSCLLECTNHACQEIVANSGTGSVDFDVEYDDEGIPYQDWGDFFRPKYFSPHLNMLVCPKGTPDYVLEEIQKSFSAFFCDAASAANHLRIALENLLTHLKVKRYGLRKNKRVFQALHSRIELLPAKYRHLQDLFFAVKWLGNAGSHNDRVVAMDDVLDAYEIMEEILQDMFVKKTERAKRLARKINTTKGPSKSAKKA